MGMSENLDIYMKEIDEALIPVGKRLGLELRCGDVIYAAYNFTIDLKGVVKTETIDGQRDVFNQRASLYNFSPEDYGKEFEDGGKRFRFIGFNKKARTNHCEILCLNNNKIYKCKPLYIRSMLQKASLSGSSHTDAITSADQKIILQKTVSFFSAECMETYSLGEFHDNLTVSQAVESYNKIPSERLNAIKGIGITVHTNGLPNYTDAHYDLMQLCELNPDVIELAGGDRELVQNAYQELLDYLQKNGVKYKINHTTTAKKI